MVRISEISKEQMHVWWENCRQRNLTTKDSLPCPICGSESKTGYDYGPECVHFMGCGHIIRIKQELPSIEQCSSWIYARLPAEVSRQKISDAILWALTSGDEYKTSGKIYPRNIYESDLITPVSEIDRFLQGIDYSLLDEFHSSDPEQFPYILCGKWLLFIPNKEIDATWVKLSNLIETGVFQYEAKVSTKCGTEKDHVICIYVHNYLLHQDVLDCREVLHTLGYTSRIFFKPDEFTSLHMYANQTDTIKIDDDFEIPRRFPSPDINHRYYG